MKRVAVVTGASSGIGRAIAQYYHNEGFHVVGIQRHTIGSGTNSPVDTEITEDLSTPGGVAESIIMVEKQFGKIDVLINNAGIMPFNEIDNRNKIIHLNLFAPIILSESLDFNYPGAHVINIASVSGIMGDPEVSTYSATKAALINLTRSWAKYSAPAIRFNCISPGFFKTNLVPGPTPKHLIDKVPMKREAQPYEIIPVVDMLQKSPYITGANIVIDGGLSL